ncbi:membrane protein insertase YidC [Colwellia sp. MB02u-18]|uniref:membrane protein insertase YidC n=1 Tax=unclassified Colwellia TaxID=196834 RepID=UPI0015F71172|nr:MULTISPECIES: membrane protein insertase YidC [unclassified Colwellia]MBA6225544.1 membrane protein insertase YidC [Colwellia sp. MB3u-45]MBA6268273.1 membrane protein insertase YidC [Colwellia sp. MB3u-43]MBA6321704.1 membrane protein insertase YidC [Colwellia sp. MB02u-19]MBA6324101.1 membrane protein insertase YidC [Colwellia sp. MB02u-18]MBA6330874.1 membrane protein insertase YidC [Colwellia sp. MB02u-12]
MESQRSFLFIALMVVTYLLFNQWQTDKAPILEQPAVTQQTTPSTSNGEFVPESSATATSISNETKVVSATLITVKNDVLSLKIDTNGGDIVEAKLLKFDTEQGNGIPFTILRNDRDRYVAQSGLTGAQGLDRVIPGRPIYQTSATSYQADAGEPLVIDLNYLDDAGLSVTKRFTLNYDSYAINVEYIIANNATSPASVQMYAQLKQTTLIDSSSGLIPTYVGAAYSTTEDIYEKYDFDDIAEANLSVTTQGGWVAMLQHYFVSSWVPEKTSDNQLYTRYSSNKDAVIGFKAPAITIEPNSTATTSATFYVGPKDQDVLESIEQNLDLTIDYGFLFMISQPLFWLLIKIQSIVTNWGVAIIIITLIVKGGMYPLTKAQYTSMAKMRALQPKMAQLKERLGDDKQKMSQAMMELYRKEKVNPAGGCLPLIIQMPIFLALYWVFLESVELRHAPFMLWIQDLSAQDPFYILPVLMGVSMFIMQKMQPMTVQDPMQQKIMQYMPVMFTVFFFWFPSGLVLYWLVSNLISIAQMKIIFSGIEKAKEKEKAK